VIKSVDQPMLRHSSARLLAVLLLTGIALAQAPKTAATPPLPSPQPVAATIQIMRGMILPAADRIFKAGSEAPKTPQEWTQLEYDALNIAEAANLLMIGTRVKDRGNWLKFAKGLRDAAAKTYKVAQTKNVDAMVDVGGTLPKLATLVTSLIATFPEKLPPKRRSRRASTRRSSSALCSLPGADRAFRSRDGDGAVLRIYQ
jgi:hypothetical protein